MVDYGWKGMGEREGVRGEACECGGGWISKRAAE